MPSTPLQRLSFSLALVATFLSSACGGGGDSQPPAAAAPPVAAPPAAVPPAAAPPVAAPPAAPAPPAPPAVNAVDVELRAVILANGLNGDPRGQRRLPSIDDPLPQLGKLLFFSKALSAKNDTACASCHHPALGGADGLSLSIGVGAQAPDLVGPGRRRADGQILVGRNANTFFNSGLFDQVLFWDGRVESLGKETGAGGSASGIRTPATGFGIADPLAGPNLLAAQARSPVVTAPEMRADGFPTLSQAELREHIAARLGNFGTGQGGLPPSQWLSRFRSAFGAPAGSAEQLISFSNIMLAIAEYQRSATFVDTPWRRYIQGDNSALSDTAKRGALVFFKDVGQGGGQCAQCHKGDFFTDEKFHAIGFPQIGPGMGDAGRDDLGRQRSNGDMGQTRAFRTPSLLNVELSAPYGHAGAYATLTQVMEHYVFPQDTVNAFLASRQWCSLPQLAADAGCSSDVTDVERNTRAGLARMEAVRAASPTTGMPVINVMLGSPEDTPRLVEFMKALTDPCLKDRACLSRWIPRPDEAPDGLQLNAVDALGRPL